MYAFILLPSTLVAVYRFFLLLFDRNEMVIWGWVCDKTTLNWLKKGNVVRMIGVHTSVSLIIAMCKCWIQWRIWWANQIQVSDSRYLIINSCFRNLIKGLRNYLKWLKTIFCLYRKKFRPKQKKIIRRSFVYPWAMAIGTCLVEVLWIGWYDSTAK